MSSTFSRHYRSLEHRKDNSVNILRIVCLTLTNWSLEHIIACKLLITLTRRIPGPSQRISWIFFKRREDFVSYLENRHTDQLYWKSSWLYVSEVIIHGAKNSLCFLGSEGWKVILQSKLFTNLDIPR